MAHEQSARSEPAFQCTQPDDQSEWRDSDIRLLGDSVGHCECADCGRFRFRGKRHLWLVGANGVFEMTNVPTDRRFRPAESHVSRLSHRVSVEEVEDPVERYAWQFHLHPDLLLAVIKAESDFNPTVISRAGAVGLMQLIPKTALRHGV